METITKAKITNALNYKLGLSAIICEEIVNSFFTEIINIANVEKLTLKNFGSFKVVQKSSRPAVNLQTKERIILSPRKVLRFAPSRWFKNSINKNS